MDTTSLSTAEHLTECAGFFQLLLASLELTLFSTESLLHVEVLIYELYAQGRLSYSHCVIYGAAYIGECIRREYGGYWAPFGERWVMIVRRNGCDFFVSPLDQVAHMLTGETVVGLDDYFRLIGQTRAT